METVTYDAGLIRGCQADSRAAWDAFAMIFLHVAQRVVRVLVRVYHVDPSTAEDAVEEVFLKLREKLAAQISGCDALSMESFEYYLYKVVLREARRVLRGLKSEDREQLGTDALPADAVERSDSLSEGTIKRWVGELVATLESTAARLLVRELALAGEPADSEASANHAGAAVVSRTRRHERMQVRRAVRRELGLDPEKGRIL
jgi:DNA-directed RNA polymerase specialized sigma24 family protein